MMKRLEAYSISLWLLIYMFAQIVNVEWVRGNNCQRARFKSKYEISGASVLFSLKYDTDASWAKTHNFNRQNIISNKFSSRYGKTYNLPNIKKCTVFNETSIEADITDESI